MQFFKASLLMCLGLATTPIDASKDPVATTRNLRSGRGRRPLKQACLLAVAETQFADGHDEKTVECILQGEDVVRNGRRRRRWIKVNGLGPDFVREYNVYDGETTLFVEGSEVDDVEEELVLPASPVFQIGRQRRRNPRTNANAEDLFGRRRLAQTKTVLVIRVVASDTEVAATEEQIAEDVFGGEVTLGSQYTDCSYGELNFVATSDHNDLFGDDGVMTVAITQQANGTTRSSLKNEAISTAEDLLEADLEDVADHIMICLPPGSSGDWIAYAYISGQISIYNDEWCNYPSAQMHEIGHNLRLGHSNENDEYDDQSGLMGYSYKTSTGPLMCFNGAKTYQLGWFADRHVELSTSNSNWVGDLVGFSEQDLVPDDSLIVRIETSASDYYYIHYNRDSGFNSGTKEGKDLVMIATGGDGEEYHSSTLEAVLDTDESYTIQNFDGMGGDLVINVVLITTSGTPRRASILIGLGTPQTDAPVVTPTDAPAVPLTEAPVVPPTGAPVVPPTDAPVKPPTDSPVVPPTDAPVIPPTDAPVVPPTDAPVEPPTDSPVDPPTDAPAVPPTDTPVEPPTDSPVVPPTDAPVVPPTDAPAVPPTDAPVVPPTDAPAVPPTDAPVEPPTDSPVVPPTDAPVEPPTDSPVVPPTDAPVVPPTEAPVVPPTETPVVPPTKAPINQGPCGDCGSQTGANTPECNGQPEDVCLRMAQHEGKCMWNRCNSSPTEAPVASGPCAICEPVPEANTPECYGQSEDRCLQMIQYEQKCMWAANCS